MAFVDDLLSVAVPVAKMATDLLPLFLGLLDEESSEGGPLATATLFDFVAHRNEKGEMCIYLVNMSHSPITVTVATEQFRIDQAPNTSLSVSAVSGAIESYGIQAEMFELDGLMSTLVTEDFTGVYADAGVYTGNYQSPPDAGDLTLLPGRTGMVRLPLIVASAFFVFKSIEVRRTTVDLGVYKSDKWIIKSDVPLLSLTFDYVSSVSERLNWRRRMGKTEGAGDGPPYIYEILTDREGQATGPLTDFSLTVEAEPAAFATLLSPREQISVDALPPAAKRQLRRIE